MKILLTAMPLCVCLLLGWMFWSSLQLDGAPSVQTGRELPHFELPVLGSEETLAQPQSLPQEPYLLNVWASWCFPCRVEHPVLMRAAEQGVKIVGLNYRDEPEDARRWLSESGDPYVLSLSDREGALALDLGVTGVPETFVLDADGVVLYHRVGVLSDDIWEQELRPRLGR